MDIIERYSAYLTAHGHPAGTIEQYTGYPRRLLTDLDCHADQVTGELLVGWLAGHRWAPNTRRKAVANLRLFFTWTAQAGLTDTDPTGVLKPVRGAIPVPRPMPEDDYAAALARATALEVMQLRLAADTGLRRAELAATHSDHVTRGVLGWVLWVDGKGRRQRHVPLPADLAGWVKQIDGWVWPSPHGGHMIPSAVGKRYRRLLGGQWTTHSLRHRFATRAYAASHDIEAVRTLLGHESVRTTQIYIATGAEQLRVVAQGAWDITARDGTCAA
jgi:site-specific recombinase XerD